MLQTFIKYLLIKSYCVEKLKKVAEIVLISGRKLNFSQSDSVKLEQVGFES